MKDSLIDATPTQFKATLPVVFVISILDPRLVTQAVVCRLMPVPIAQTNVTPTPALTRCVHHVSLIQLHSLTTTVLNALLMQACSTGHWVPANATKAFTTTRILYSARSVTHTAKRVKKALLLHSVKFAK